MEGEWIKVVLVLVICLGALVVLGASLWQTRRLADQVTRLEGVLGWAIVLHREGRDSAPNTGSGSQHDTERKP